jgi:DNA phosphorothioation-associated putative methyltransferase
MERTALSRPISVAMTDDVLRSDLTLFDYGCGKGGDIRRLRQLGYQAAGWDPAFAPHEPRSPADVVNLGYVVNVVEDPRERLDTLRAAWALARRVLIVAGRMSWERQHLRGVVHADGVVTSRNTFQKFFDQDELRGWIDAALGVNSVPASPGIFYVFRDEVEAQHHLARRHRRRVAVPRIRRSSALYEEHQTLLAPLVEFVTERGRLPRDEEIPSEELKVVFGSLKAAFAVIRRATGDDQQWEELRRSRADELVIYVALSAFGGRPTFSTLPSDIQYDVRDFFGSYRAACARADELLFSAGDMSQVSAACAASQVGKLTPEALYVHGSGLAQLPPLLRVYEGCATALAGSVTNANIIKLNRLKPKVSYMTYPRFDEVPHPSLAESVVASLRELRVDVRDYRDRENPPILHRKELFVDERYPLRDRFQRLTLQEERFGLYDEPEAIGTASGWTATLEARGVALRGHRVVRVKSGSRAN